MNTRSLTGYIEPLLDPELEHIQTFALGLNRLLTGHSGL